ncbi:hypothetical protein C443_00162 [Haloarcula argentinensis DSM 12282]|nr:hypothetical protein C443_00162 [Haloarcula argentinensis DSM 12282]
MMTLITSSISFQRTLLFLGISIGLDLPLLLQLPVLSPKTTMVGLAVTGGLAVASGIALVQYVETTLERSTPEGLLQAYTNQLTADSHRDQVINSREQDGALHPMHELHSFVMSGLSNGEWATAENGLIEFERVSQGVIEELAGRGDLQRTDALAGHYFKTPIQEYLPRITAQAIEDGESDLARQAVQSIERITETGLKCYYPLIISSATSGLSRIIREAPDGEDGDSIRRRCLRVYSNLLTTVVEYPYSKDVFTLLSLYSSQFRKLLIRDREPWVYRHELEEFFRRSIGPAHKQTVGQYGQYISELDVDWHNRTQSMDAEGIAPYNMLFTYRRYSLEVIGYILNYYSRNEEWPLSPGVLRETWSNMLSDAISANTGRYSQAVCRWYIDLAYLICQAGDGNIGDWAVRLEKIEDYHDSAEMVDDAFDEALEKGMTAAFEGKGGIYRLLQTQDHFSIR